VHPLPAVPVDPSGQAVRTKDAIGVIDASPVTGERLMRSSPGRKAPLGASDRSAASRLPALRL
jgi:hypothetical protein